MGEGVPPHLLRGRSLSHGERDRVRGVTVVWIWGSVYQSTCNENEVTVIASEAKQSWVPRPMLFRIVTAAGARSR